MHRRHPPPPTPPDDLWHLWEADNHRDPQQHAAALRLAGRKISNRKAHQDYFRQQRRQRQSKARGLKDSLITEPNAVVDHVTTKLTAQHILETLPHNQALALRLVIGANLTLQEAADATRLSHKELRSNLASGLRSILGKFSREGQN